MIFFCPSVVFSSKGGSSGAFSLGGFDSFAAAAGLASAFCALTFACFAAKRAAFSAFFFSLASSFSVWASISYQWLHIPHRDRWNLPVFGFCAASTAGGCGSVMVGGRCAEHRTRGRRKQTVGVACRKRRGNALGVSRRRECALELLLLAVRRNITSSPAVGSGLVPRFYSRPRIMIGRGESLVRPAILRGFGE
jgi:hypothetical protein